MFWLGKIDYKIRKCPTGSSKEGDNHRRAQPYPFSGPSGGRKKDRFYALQTRQDHEGSPIVVIYSMYEDGV
ncbi:hypothetical protein MTR67_051321 [Solanum verrucosum]|uniref:Uncharacterized protein n=1 Tax=Solanum verrucosum TaxID=315347 RepID=A0AAF0V715_SOLVR|nr:hypothetical protein MTR67_051321 [Solanum verrucosum]